MFANHKFALTILFIGLAFVGKAQADTPVPSTATRTTTTTTVITNTVVADAESAIIQKTPNESLNYLAAAENQYAALEEKFLINLNGKSFVDECKEYFCNEVVKNMKEMKNLEKQCNESKNGFLEAICWGTYHSMKSIWTIQCHDICTGVDEGKIDKPARKEIQDWLDEYKSKLVGGGKF